MRAGQRDFEVNILGEISTNVHSEIAKKHRNLRLVWDQPIFGAQIANAFPLVPIVEDYFHRSTEVLLDSIKTAASHHGDLTSGDVQRAMALLESVYNLAVVSRARCVPPKLVTVEVTY